MILKNKSLLMSINYENIYRSKLSMISPIIHNSIFLKIDGQYLCKIIYDHCILCLQITHHHYKTQIWSQISNV
jgi:hypothetical protein